MNFLTNIAQYYFEHPFHLLLILVGIQFAFMVIAPAIQKHDNKATDILLGAIAIFGFAGFSKTTPDEDSGDINAKRYLSPFFTVSKYVGACVTAIAFMYSLFGILNKFFMMIGLVAQSVGGSVNTIFQAGFGILIFYILGLFFIPMLLLRLLHIF